MGEVLHQFSSFELLDLANDLRNAHLTLNIDAVKGQEITFKLDETEYQKRLTENYDFNYSIHIYVYVHIFSILIGEMRCRYVELIKDLRTCSKTKITRAERENSGGAEAMGNTGGCNLVLLRYPGSDGKCGGSVSNENVVSVGGYTGQHKRCW